MDALWVGRLQLSRVALVRRLAQAGWRTPTAKPAANRDLWEPLIELYLPRGPEIVFRWVKGHAGDEWNQIVDQLATGAASDQRSRRGL